MRVVGLAVGAMVLAACNSESATTIDGAPPTPVVIDGPGVEALEPQDLDDAGPAPTGPVIEEGALAPEVVADVDRAVDDVVSFIGESTNPVDPAVFSAIAAHGDLRLAWVLADMGQFIVRDEPFDALLQAGNDLTAGDFSNQRTFWKGMSDLLIENDIPAPPDYARWKQELLTAVDVTWIHPFNDTDADIDWRLVTFGGVLADTRPFGSAETCSCIPALDDPPAVPAAEGDWYPGNRAVFGMIINGEARAYPLNIMEAHELVNDTLGDRAISLTYCTLCRSATAYYVDQLPAGVTTPVLRTSGLLRRSNKLVLDRETDSLFDQFTGVAISGPQREAGLELERITVQTATWDDWRAAHPETTLMAGKDGNGANYPLDPLGDRDAGGPIFPIGAVDDRFLPSHRMIGTVAVDPPVAFSVESAVAALESGGDLIANGVTVLLEGGGLRLVDAQGNDLASSQANWFAWSQRFPDTLIWPN